jgi:hypothetical protein
MDPVRPGDRGPAVEDIQRRLRTLGYDLGRAGIDGIYAGATAEAVAAFQRARGLDEDGYVADETWSALVDETFTLGDRMLYLRVPHFHGRDVRVLQEALNVLGFACGATDGIFGAFTERAVRELQRNAGVPVDGIVGAETVRAVASLRHVWEGKEPLSHSAAHLSFARAADVLARTRLVVDGLDDAGMRVAARVINLAMATSDASRISWPPAGEVMETDTALVLRICAGGTACATPWRPVVSSAGEVLASRLMTAMAAVPDSCPDVVIELAEEVAGDEREEQRAAIAVLDAVCVVFG